MPEYISKCLISIKISLFFQRPDEIADDIKKDMDPFLDKDTRTVNRKLFDQAVGQMVNVIVSYDMGWSKRGNGRSYDSLNGYGTIIGFLS